MPSLLLFALSFFIVIQNAQAMSLRELRALEKSGKEGLNYASYYLVGVMEGAMEAQLDATRAGGKARVCLNGRKLEPKMAKDLFHTELKRNADIYEADMPVQLVMNQALLTVYPCS